MVHAFFATAPLGLAELLAQELTALGGVSCRCVPAGVHFEGSFETSLRICLWSRLAGRIVLPLCQAEVTDTQSLYDWMLSIPWQDHFSAEHTFAVRLQLAGASHFSHSQFAALRVKDAIVDSFRARTGNRPTVELQAPDVRVNVHLLGRRYAAEGAPLDALPPSQVTLSLEVSDGSLHRRGYRADGAQAPLKENLAAALLLRSGWPADGPLVDPMCGSGTLLIEAAMMAFDAAPGVHKVAPLFAAQHPENLAALLQEAAQRRQAAQPPATAPCRFFGSDSDPQAIRAARSNIFRAGLQGHIELSCSDIRDLRSPVAGAHCEPTASPHGHVICNLPYGQRVGEKTSLLALYSQVGKTLCSEFAGYKAHLLLQDAELGHALGMRATRRHSFYNGALPCKLLHFSVPLQPRTQAAPLKSAAPANAAAAQAASEWGSSDCAAAAAAHPLQDDQHGALDGHLPSGVSLAAENQAALRNRLRKNLASLGKWAASKNISCYRLYDRDLPQYAVAIDYYAGRYAVVQEYQAPASIDPRRVAARRRDVLQVLPEVLPEVALNHIYLKMRQKMGGNKQYTKVLDHQSFHQVSEAECQYLVNFTDYLDCGIFLDHRPVRALIKKLAAKKKFLNLFGYTGCATVCAAAGGASYTETIDLSQTYLSWAARNFALNRLPEGKHVLVQADCLQYLQEPGTLFDLILLDPPTFSNSKRMHGTFDVQRDHAPLIHACLQRLAPGGTLIFSTNARRFVLDPQVAQEAQVRDITARTIDKDFARHKAVHCCYLIDRGETRAASAGATEPAEPSEL
jgi:23S rRNA (guanine2445-N2)-methyltransferase / 23S rRNA (guanine2069-N7)-methyltransferase